MLSLGENLIFVLNLADNPNIISIDSNGTPSHRQTIYNIYKLRFSASFYYKKLRRSLNLKSKTVSSGLFAG